MAGDRVGNRVSLTLAENSPSRCLLQVGPAVGFCNEWRNKMYAQNSLQFSLPNDIIFVC